MRIFKRVEVENYRNIRIANLNGLKDFNIIIGPNNCGKTNILNFIFSLKSLEFGNFKYHCEDCQQAFNEIKSGVNGLRLRYPIDDFHLQNVKEHKLRIKISLDEIQIERILPGVLQKQRRLIHKKKSYCSYNREYIKLENENGTELFGIHLSPFIQHDIIDWMKNSILYPPKGLLRTNCEEEINKFIDEKNFNELEFRKLRETITRLVDPKIHDHSSVELIRRLKGGDFYTTIKDQGSGVISIFGLIANILSNRDAKIVLIDEPELGLNPHAKQEFLKFLLEESQYRQIFITTQDPTFVNPTLWGNKGVALYLYSVYDDEFHQVNLDHTKQAPNIFAGYLPHTGSLKDVHIYVEGSSDVYIFQIMLEKYLKTEFINKWWVYLNRIGIFHMSGSFYVHFLYTIPKPPYKCIVILDGDKKWETQNVCRKYNESLSNVSKFKFCKNLSEVKPFFENRDVIENGSSQPVYCLEKKCIEKYFFNRFNCKHPPKNYYKNIDGPKRAEERWIPKEIEQLLKIIVNSLR